MLMNLILITGMPGARKSDVSRLMASYGNTTFNMSHIIAQELKASGLAHTPDNYHKCAQEMRSFHGPEILAKRTLEQLRNVSERIKIIDGIRTPEELSYFRSQSDFCRLVLVHASRRSRHERMRSRSGPELQNESQLESLDRQNLQLGLAEVMADSDYVIINGNYLGQDLTQTTYLVYRAIIEELIPVE
jgi:dephospho-CoA kinase